MHAQQLQLYFDAVDEGYYALDADWRVVFANRSALRLWGLRFAELHNREYLKCFPQAAGSASYQAHERVMATRVGERLETLSPALDRWIDVTIGPLDDGGLLVSLRDIAARTPAEIEERLALAVSIGELACWDWDLRSGVVTWNDRHFLLQGYAVGEVTPSFDAWLARVHPEDRDGAIAGIDVARETKTEFIHEFRSVLPNRSVRWCSARGRFFYDANGDAYRMVGVMNDITVRKREQRHREALLRLDESLRTVRVDDDARNATFRRLSDALDVPLVYWWEFDGQHVHINAFDVAQGSASRRELTAVPFGTDALLSLRAGQTVVDVQVDRALLSGDARAFVEEAGVASRLDVPMLLNGVLVGGVGVADMSAREWPGDECALVEQVATRGFDAMQRGRAEAALKMAERRKDEFLAMLAHELRNPLAPIRSSVDVLRLDDDEENGRHRQLLGRIDRQLTHMVRLVDDLMDVSRISRGQLRLRLDACAMAALIDEAVDACSYDFERYGHTLTVDTAPALPAMMLDRARVVQVICNLLTNAAKYTNRGGQIQLRSYISAPWLCISVTDTGIGIDPRSHDSVFDLFTQETPTAGRGQSGLGIGLNLVRQLVQLHGGDVILSSAIGRGSTFTVRLPMSRAVEVESR